MDTWYEVYDIGDKFDMAINLKSKDITIIDKVFCEIDEEEQKFIDSFKNIDKDK